MSDPSIRLFPSVLSADFSCLSEDVEPLVGAGCEQLHLDVMDGHFVPNLSIGVPVVASLADRFPVLHLDVHLMIENPIRYVEPFLEAGADSLSVHVETDPPLDSIVEACSDAGARIGLAFNPDSPVEPVEHLQMVDYAVLMGVQPGFGGQSFQESVLEKIERLRRQWSKPIQVDGGVNERLLPRLIEHGATWFVAGSAVFGKDDPAEAYRTLLDRSRSGD